MDTRTAIQNFHRDLFEPSSETPAGRRAAADVAAVAPLAFSVAGLGVTYRSDGERITWSPEVADDAGCVVAVSPTAYADFMSEIRTAAGITFSGDATFPKGRFEDLVRWEPALRALLGERPIFDPDSVPVAPADPDGIDLEATFAADDVAGAADHFRRAGFAVIRGLFTEAEVAELRDVSDALAKAALPGDDRSWWARTGDRRSVCCRLVYINERDERVAALHDDPRLRSLLDAAGFGWLDCRPDRMEGHSVVIKIPGVVEGLADLPWHQDCGLGGHPWMCPSIAFGIQLDEMSSDSGQMHFLAGSQGHMCHPFEDAELVDMPRAVVSAQPGDVTMHTADVMHAAPPPAGDVGRRTLYVTFHNPALFERIGPGEAINDLVRRQRPDGQVDPTRLGIGGTPPTPT